MDGIGLGIGSGRSRCVDDEIGFWPRYTVQCNRMQFHQQEVNHEVQGYLQIFCWLREILEKIHAASLLAAAETLLT